MKNYQFDDELCSGITCMECAFRKKDDYGHSQCLLSLRLEEHGYNTVHAHWVDGGNIGFYHCSNCGGAAACIVEWAQKYCLHCGARMDEVSV